MSKPFVTILIPCYNEEGFIAKTLDAMLGQTFPLPQMEIFVIDGESTDRSREIISSYAAKHSQIKLLHNPGRTAPKALNMGIEKASGEIIIRVDAHCIYPAHYIATLVETLQELNADNVGGSWKTLPANDSIQARAVAVATSHKFGVGGSQYRSGTKKTIQVETVPYGCYPKRVFEKIGKFDEDLVRNQDDEFNARLIQNGGKIYLIGGLEIGYFARETISKAAHMFYQYGLFKPLVNKKLKNPATLRQFAPPLFVLAWFAVILWWVFTDFTFALPLIALMVVYFVPAFYIGLTQAVKNNTFSFIFLLPYVFFVFHMAYGIGYLQGIYEFLIRDKKTINVQSRR